MTFEIVRPDDESGEPGADAVAFRQAQENLRNAPGDLEARGLFREALRLRRQTQALRRRAGSGSVRWKRYRRLRELGYTPEGARWEIGQDAAEGEADYPDQKPVEAAAGAYGFPGQEASEPLLDEWYSWHHGHRPRPSLVDSIEPFIPGKVLTVAEAALAYTDRQPLRGASTVKEIEHWIGKPYKSEIPPAMAYTYKELNPPETEAERARRESWEFAQELLGAIARGELQTVPQRQAPQNKYAQAVSLDDALRLARARGSYGHVFAPLLLQRPKNAVAADAGEEIDSEEVGVAHAESSAERDQQGADSPPSADGTEPGPPLGAAPSAEIDRAITAVYDAEEASGNKPPNKRQIIKPTQKKLATLGLKTSGRKIMKIAEDPKHAKRRRPVGPTIASEKRRSDFTK